MRRRLLLVATLAVFFVAGLGARPALAAGVVTPNEDGYFTFTGRGFGHGRGMGQWGALGYAVDHGWSAEEILLHFYGGTRLATDAGNPVATVELQAHNGLPVRICAPGMRLNGDDVSSRCVQLVADGPRLDVMTGPGCAGPWTEEETGLRGDVRVEPSNNATTYGRMLLVCDPDSTAQAGIHYRGAILGRVRGGTQYTINETNTQDLLRGVIAREIPALWGQRGGGRGMATLEAQTVAARSFKLSTNPTPRSSGADSCDTIDCQVHGGAGRREVGGRVTSREHALTNAAIDTTEGWVMRRANGTIARTEYSASTGGWTAGGEFPSVEDLGDATSDNPNRAWITHLSAEQIGEALDVGVVRSLTVLDRNGLGEMGGRVTSIRVAGSAATRTVTGLQLRMAVGSTILRSDWFEITSVDRVLIISPAIAV